MLLWFPMILPLQFSDLYISWLKWLKAALFSCSICRQEFQWISKGSTCSVRMWRSSDASDHPRCFCSWELSF